MYYKLIFTYQTKSGSRSHVVCVQIFSEENLNEAIQNIVKEKNIPSDYTVKIEKTTLKKLAEEDKQRVLDELEDEYLMLKYGSDIFNSKEYTRLKFKQVKDYFAARNTCADLMNYLCACRKVRQTVDATKITIAEFDKMVLGLINSDTNEANGNFINERRALN